VTTQAAATGAEARPRTITTGRFESTEQADSFAGQLMAEQIEDVAACVSSNAGK
jgi:mono/diheme cytochrome c family protein